MPIRLILADIDGCISPEASCAWDGTLFEEFARLSRAASAGDVDLPPLTLCTGRPQPYVEALMKILDIRYPAICEAGAVIYRLADNRSQFAPEITVQMIQGLHRLRDYIVAEVLPAFPGLVYQFGKEAQMSLFTEKPECFDDVAAKVKAHAATIPGLKLSITPSHYYLNIDFEGVTKGAAIRRLLDELGLERSEAAGIGDTMGDISIRDAVAFFACPENAVPAIKEVADYVSPYADIRGVLDILARPELNGVRTPV